jgi:hypothetical protein
MSPGLAWPLLNKKGPSNDLQFVTPAPYQVLDELRREYNHAKNLWIPACAGMTFLEEPKIFMIILVDVFIQN